jgi:archaellin
MNKSNASGIGLIGISVILLVFLTLATKQPRPNRGTVGIEALIVFISLVIVASIAAAVMISTGGSLQNKALKTGNDAREGVTSNLEITQIRGLNPSASGTSHRVHNFGIIARLAAGSEMMSLNNTVITIDTMAGSQSYIYGGNVSASVHSGVSSTYVVTYIQSGTYSEPGLVNLGDMVKLKFNITNPIGEGEKARITLMPQVGNPTQLEFQTPENMISPEVVLWPTT